MADKLWIFALALPVAVFGAVVASTNRRLLLYALPFLVAMNGLAPKVGTQRIRLDQLAAVFLVAGLVPPLLTGRRRLKIDTVTVWLIVLALVNVVASLANSQARLFSLMEILSIGSSWSIYAILLNTLTTRRDLERFVTVLLVAGIVECIFGIAAFGIGVAGFPMFGANTKDANDLSAAFGSYGTLYEPNMFGSYCGGYLVLAAGMAWKGWRHMTLVRRGLVRTLLVVSALGLLLSFTRGAWLGTMVGFAGLGLLANRALGHRLPIRAILVTTTVGVLVVVGALFAPGQVGEIVSFKLNNIINPTTASGITRIITYIYAWNQYLKHPLLGCGTYTFEVLIAGGSVDFTTLGYNLWIGNYLLLALHDTGIVGVVALLGIFITLILIGARVSRQLWAVDRSMAATTLAATAVIMSYMVSFIFTTALSFGYPWVFMGVIGAYGQIARRISPPLPAPRQKVRIPRTTAVPQLAAGGAGPQ